MPVLGDRPVGSVRPSEVQAWAARLKLAPSTATIALGLVTAVLAAAVDDRLIARNPAAKVRVRQPDHDQTVPLTVAEVEAIADNAGRLHAAVLVAGMTGVRQGELFGLTADRVGWLRRELVVDRQLVTPSRGRPAFGPVKSKRSNRVVPLADRTLEVLAAHVDGYGTGEAGLLFTSTTGAAISRAYGSQLFRRAADRAGVQASGWHALRHHAASTMIAQGLGVTAVAATLGHTAEVCLRTYAAWWPAEGDQIRQAVGRAWSSREYPAGGTQTGPIGYKPVQGPDGA